MKRDRDGLFRLKGSERRTTRYQVGFRASVAEDGTITDSPGIDVERDDADGEDRLDDIRPLLD
ncbi:hypothetical protein BG842_01805 [Haladaptatus sp. W1]|uniref:hypothetical protein n=1 Tax=Haladaptatus sp. W1 TaxID=1897478 RepID=UPI000849B2F4|nr:hypothetical protein [Haladaptatus sp. W1]ODR81068.1 hypothetical protein BG842_01805 [Haladaptatus sp. W1]